jgi:hypothetical protein
MARRLAPACLLLAWLCASGAMLDVAQVVAWSRMFAGYARSECVLSAARDTFDPERPCALCRAVSKAREASSGRGQAAPDAGARKMVMVFQAVETLVAPAPGTAWTETQEAPPKAMWAEVPLPPPRTALA